MWFQKLANTEEYLQKEVSVMMLYYRGLLFKFKKYCQEPNNKYFGKAQMLDLADILSDLTIGRLNEEIKNEIQWLITELHQMANTAPIFRFAFSEGISTAKKGKEIRIMLSVDNKKTYFGNGQDFAESFKKLILDMHQ